VSLIRDLPSDMSPSLFRAMDRIDRAHALLSSAGAPDPAGEDPPAREAAPTRPTPTSVGPGPSLNGGGQRPAGAVPLSRGTAAPGRAVATVKANPTNQLHDNGARPAQRPGHSAPVRRPAAHSRPPEVPEHNRPAPTK
jgi:hypothetical protein